MPRAPPGRLIDVGGHRLHVASAGEGSPPVLLLMQSVWSQPKCFHAMADHLMTLERDAAAIARIVVPREIPVVVISSGNQPSEQLDVHRRLAEASDEGRHVIVARSAHWVQFDEPELIIDAARELVVRRRDAAEQASQ